MSKTNIKTNFKVNDFVIEKEGNNMFGLISEVHKKCPMTNEWLEGLNNPVKAESVRSTWYSILVIGGGEICVPAYSIRELTNLENQLLHTNI